MKVHAVHEMAAGVQAQVVRALPPLPPGLDAVIERHWLAAQQRTAGKLFNGQVFSVETITPNHLSGHFTEYRRIVAQMADPALHEVLRIRPLAVCGAVRCADGIILGRRDRHAAYDAGIWQLPPAGNVDPRAAGADGAIDLYRHLFTELEEELGWSAADILALQPLCMIEHAGSHVLDLGFGIELAADTAAVLAAHRGAADAREYDPLIVVPWNRLAEELTELGAGLMPTAWIFLRRLGLV